MSSSPIRYALRSLRLSPGFALAVILSFALGIGATCTMFAVVSAVLLRPLPYPGSDALIAVAVRRKDAIDEAVPDVQFREWASASRTLSSIALYNPMPATVDGGRFPEVLDGEAVSPGIFSLLGVRPMRGRTFRDVDTLPGAEPVVMLSAELWRAQFGGDSLIVGRHIQIDDKPVRVVGVMPSGFSFPLHAAFWRPWTPPTSGMITFVHVVARLRPGVSRETAQAELERLSPAVGEAGAVPSRGAEAVVVISLHDQLFGSARPALTILFAAVLLLLLIACANVTGLLLARALRRQRELAVRASLGASRWALALPVVVEVATLALLGGAVGLLVSIWTTRLFVDVSPLSITGAGDIGVTGWVVVFATLVTVGAALLASAGPALRVAGSDPGALLRGAEGHGGNGRFTSRLRRGLVVAQLAVTVVLLSGAGLLLESFSRLTSVDLGFRAERVLVVTIHLPSVRYRSGEQASVFFHALAERLRGAPGVMQVGYGLPPFGRFTFLQTSAPGTEHPDTPLAETSVSSGYFDSYGVPLVAGRPILATDDATAAPVVVINGAAVRAFFPGVDPVGRPFDRYTVGGKKAVVVGVAADVVQEDIGTRTVPEVFLPFAQYGGRPETIAIRTAGDPVMLAPFVRAAVRELDPALAISDISTIRDMVSDRLAPHRFLSLLAGSLAALALILAGLGLYGVVSFLAAQRTREFGVRVALGAPRESIVRLVVGDASRMVVPGIAIGAGTAVASSRVMRALLCETSPRDPIVLMAVSLTLCVVGIVASLVPAWRAVRTDPLAALRAE